MIDIKELRVGSHVMIGKKMERITTIDVLNGRIGIDFYREDENGFKYAIGYPLGTVDPIPITGKLLVELGFVRISTIAYKYPIYTHYIDAVSASMERELYKSVNPKVSIYEKFSNLFCVSATNERGVSCKTFVRHLHELENFVYSVRKQEIEEINGK